MKQKTMALEKHSQDNFAFESFQSHPVHAHRLNDLCLLLKKTLKDKVKCNNIKNELTPEDVKKIEDFKNRFDTVIKPFVQE